MSSARWLLTLLLTLLALVPRDLATGECGHPNGHGMAPTAGSTVVAATSDTPTDTDCATHPFHHSASGCGSMQACIVNVAIPTASAVCADPGVETAQRFGATALPHSRATLPGTPPPR